MEYEPPFQWMEKEKALEVLYIRVVRLENVYTCHLVACQAFFKKIIAKIDQCSTH